MSNLELWEAFLSPDRLEDYRRGEAFHAPYSPLAGHFRYYHLCDSCSDWHLAIVMAKLVAYQHKLFFAIGCDLQKSYDAMSDATKKRLGPLRNASITSRGVTPCHSLTPEQAERQFLNQIVAGKRAYFTGILRTGEDEFGHFGRDVAPDLLRGMARAELSRLPEPEQEPLVA